MTIATAAARLRAGLAAVLFVLGLSAIASAQSATTGAIAGVVKDTTGAVLPGVTVEAASPALIEKSRTVVTDAQGNYKIVDLRPGVYSVSFTLPGFGTVRREGIDLATGFTATINADLKVGGLEETVTVSGASPVVDIQNVRTQNVLTQATLDALPTPKSFAAMAALTLGASQAATLTSAAVQDVGGNQGDSYQQIATHGNRANDSHIMQDGMHIEGLTGGGGVRHNVPNHLAIQETTLQTAGNGAEFESGGIQTNHVMKDGGNEFHLHSVVTGATERFMGDNVSDEVRGRGVTVGSKIRKVWDVGVGVGGPIKRDRLWFHVATRYWGAENFAPGNFFDSNPNDFIYTPDLSRPAYGTNYQKDPASVRITWQATAKNKLGFFNSIEDNCVCYYLVDSPFPRAPEASVDHHYKNATVSQVTWSHPRTSKLLFEGGMTYYYVCQCSEPTEAATPGALPIIEATLGLSYNAFSSGNFFGDYGKYKDSIHNERFAVSYITGSHAFKTGVTTYIGGQNNTMDQLTSIRALFFNGAPIQLTQFINPLSIKTNVRNVGAYVQDQWTIRRLTLNAGLRLDTFNGKNPAWTNPSGDFLPNGLSVEEVKNVPNWKDVNPRVGVAYDLFGTGKTAVKTTIGRYVNWEPSVIARANSPISAISTSTGRGWTDLNRNFRPDCDLTLATANGECGAMLNPAFGRTLRITSYDPDFLEGWGVRPSNWQYTATVQHELRPGMALNVGYFRTWFENFTVSDNRAVTPADYSPYCITAPVDSRLPGGGGNQLCGLYDVKFNVAPNFLVQSLDKLNVGEQSEESDYIDLSVNARFGSGGLVNGGVSFGRTVLDNCVIVDTPQAARPDFCKTTLDFKENTQFKLSAVYPIAWGIRASVNYQDLPGIPITAQLTVPAAQIAASLGRTPSAPSYVIDLIPNFTMFEDRLRQLDFRFSKSFEVGRGRIQGMFDIYNATNSGTILRERTAYGPLWTRPTTLLGARFFKLGAQIDF